MGQRHQRHISFWDDQRHISLRFLKRTRSANIVTYLAQLLFRGRYAVDAGVIIEAPKSHLVVSLRWCVCGLYSHSYFFEDPQSILYWICVFR